MSEALVDYRRGEDGIATLTLSDPPANAYSYEMMRKLDGAILDLRFARQGAGRIGLPEVGLGVLPGTGGTQRLVRLLGKARALDLMATGRLFEFEEARALGLVNDVLPARDAASFLDEVRERARAFVPPGRASRAVGSIKRAVHSGAEMSLGEGLALERELQQQLFESRDAREGLAAHLEKRKPSFEGR